MTFALPDSVRAAVSNPSVGINDPTVRGLLELANRALASQLTGQATWSEINDAVDAINRGFDECRVLVDCATGATVDSFNDRFEDRPTLNAAPEDGGNVRAKSTNRGPAANRASRCSRAMPTENPCGGVGLVPRSGPVLVTTSGSSLDTLLRSTPDRVCQSCNWSRATMILQAGVWRKFASKGSRGRSIRLRSTVTAATQARS
jgi:hypothetical protein